MDIERKTFTPPWDKPEFRRSYNFASLKKGAQAARLIGPALARKSDLAWLDGGSGSGKSASFLLDNLMRRNIFPGQITLVDRNREALNKGFVQKFLLENVAEGARPKVLSQPADIKSLPFIPEQSIDLYTLSSVIEHLDPMERKAVLEEAQRILTRNGVLLIVCPLASPFAKAIHRIEKRLGLVSGGSVDNVGHIDETHKEWFTRDLLVSTIERESDFRLRGEDFYIYGSIRSFWRVWLGSRLQALMPTSARKTLAMGGMFVFQK